MKNIAVVFIIILVLTITVGCSGMSSKQQGALSGAGLGAVGGGLLGAAVGGGAITGALIGAGVGGAAGYLIK